MFQSLWKPRDFPDFIEGAFNLDYRNQFPQSEVDYRINFHDHLFTFALPRINPALTENVRRQIDEVLDDL